MNNKCGLVNKGNPCRCPKKAKALSERGFLDPQKMEFTQDTRARIADYAENHHAEARDWLEEKYTHLFRNHPVKTDFEEEKLVEKILQEDDLLKHFEFR
jgi:hypothetical protein